MNLVSYTALTPLSFLQRSARVWPDKTAVIYGTRRLTYAEFAAETQRVARALRASGVEPGDRVAYLMPNVPELLIAHSAVPLAGGVLVAINTRRTFCVTLARRFLLPMPPCYPRHRRPQAPLTRLPTWW